MDIPLEILIYIFVY